MPSADRLHRASKATPRVSIFTHVTDLAQLRREAAARAIDRVGEIAVFLLEPAFLDAVEARRRSQHEAKLELVHSDGRLYVTYQRSDASTAPSTGASLVGAS